MQIFCARAVCVYCIKYRCQAVAKLIMESIGTTEDMDKCSSFIEGV